MPGRELKIFGAFRTGTNLVRSLLELNFKVRVHNNNYGYKHLPVPADYRDNEFRPFPIPIVATIKDPFAFLDSTFRYCQEKNYLNIDAGRTWEGFVCEPFVVFDGGFKNFPRYLFSNPVQYWNSIYRNLLSIPNDRCEIVKYETLLDQLETEILRIGEKYSLERLSEEFTQPGGVTINLGDPVREAPEDYFSPKQFDRLEHYRDRLYMERFTDDQVSFISSELDPAITQTFAYPVTSPRLHSHTVKVRLIGTLVELGDLTGERIASMPQEVDSLNSRVSCLERESRGLEQKLKETRAELLVGQRHLERQRAQVNTANLAVAKAENAAQEYRHELLELGDRHQQLQDSHAGQEKEIQQLGRQLSQFRSELDRAKTNYQDIVDSFSYKLGSGIVQAILKPGKNTILLPVRLVSELIKGIRKQSDARQVGDSGVPGPNAGDYAAVDQAPPVQVLKQASEIRVACIFDEFTMAGYRDECQLIPVSLRFWKSQFDSDPPDILFVESAWRGNGGQWEYKIGKYNGQSGSELRELIGWCRERSIPTVFWNKEDPIHFEKFIESARQFDVIFTTDSEMIPAYRAAAGHDRVFPLMFCAQPGLHNPVRTYPPEQKVCFAGSYYRNIHEERKRDMERILDIAKAYGLVIYDRNYERNLAGESEFSFPERFRENIIGSLTYEDMEKAYKGYRYCLNVNSIKLSPTMFSRRVFESLACGTPVLSTWSKGIEEVFGDLVLMCSDDLGAAEVNMLLREDEDSYHRRAVQGVREIYQRHLYEHRLVDVLDAAGIKHSDAPADELMMVCLAANGLQVSRMVDAFERQAYPNKSLLLLLTFNTGIERCINEFGGKRVSLFHLDSASVLGYRMGDFLESGFLALCAPEHYYGPHFLTDLAHAATYTEARVIGKDCRFALERQNLSMVDGKENEYTDSLWVGASMLDADLLRDLPVDKLVLIINQTSSIDDFLDNDLKRYAVNRYQVLESAFRGPEEPPQSCIEQACG